MYLVVRFRQGDSIEPQALRSRLYVQKAFTSGRCGIWAGICDVSAWLQLLAALASGTSS